MIRQLRAGFCGIAHIGCLRLIVFRRDTDFRPLDTKNLTELLNGFFYVADDDADLRNNCCTNSRFAHENFLPK
jgi:hypothetical protein